MSVRNDWLDAADRPDLIDYVVAMDSDDWRAIGETAGTTRVVSPASPDVTAVRNWNAAARVAAESADMLVVIADDLRPQQNWDAALRAVTTSCDPRLHAYAVKVSDAEISDDVLLRHPIISSAFYQRFGLFNPAFRGVYCDDDLTLRAFWRAAIVDARHISWIHDHPSNQKTTPRSDSHRRLNAQDEYLYGDAALRRIWSWPERSAKVRLVELSGRRSLTGRRLRAHRVVVISRAKLTYSAARFRSLLRRTWNGAIRRRRTPMCQL